MIDLHVHSSYSDGTDAPADLARAAGKAHVRALALTDHDNAYGVPEFLEACAEEGVTGIGGVEISASVDDGTLHILGLGIDPRNEELADALQDVLDKRDERNRRILAKLQELGLNLTWEEVAELAGEDVVGRPHFARAMIARGWCATIPEAFERYLEKGAPAYVDRFRLQPEECIRLIRGAGGVPVIAHPTSWTDDFAELRERLSGLKSAGLGGIEAYYTTHSPETTLELLRLARQLDLHVSGGSDYHGEDVKPGVHLGTGDGSLLVPDKLLAPLLAEMSPAGYVLGRPNETKGGEP